MLTHGVDCRGCVGGRGGEGVLLTHHDAIMTQEVSSFHKKHHQQQHHHQLIRETRKGAHKTHTGVTNSSHCTHYRLTVSPLASLLATLLISRHKSSGASDRVTSFFVFSEVK